MRKCCFSFVAIGVIAFMGCFASDNSPSQAGAVSSAGDVQTLADAEKPAKECLSITQETDAVGNVSVYIKSSSLAKNISCIVVRKKVGAQDFQIKESGIAPSERKFIEYNPEHQNRYEIQGARYD